MRKNGMRPVPPGEILKEEFMRPLARILHEQSANTLDSSFLRNDRTGVIASRRKAAWRSRVLDCFVGYASSQ